MHIPPLATESYFKEFGRVLKRNGIGIIHHAANGGLKGGWRSNLTNAMISGFLQNNNLKLIVQFDTWGENGRFNLKYYEDSITVFKKP